MTKQDKWLLSLICTKCGGNMRPVHEKRLFQDLPSANEGIQCNSCGALYPVVEGIPIIFSDMNRARAMLNRNYYQKLQAKANEKIKLAAGLAGADLEILKDNDIDIDALAWEILFWERWKEADDGFLSYDMQKIRQYLKEDQEGGGHFQFFQKVLKAFSGDARGKKLLNIGAGRDFLLEQFLEKGFLVVEQDIVLEPLLHLKNRGANFCVCCDARQLPFENDMFDVATSFQVLHHIWPIKQPLQQLLKVTKGNIYLNEPNHYALTRIGLLFPKPVRGILKKASYGGYSHSPYEKSINPFMFKSLLNDICSRIVDLSFKRDSWIRSNASFVKKMIRAVNLIVVGLFPIFSAHFEATIRGKN